MKLHKIFLPMPRPFATIVHTIFAAVILAIISPAFAQQKPASLVGATRAQVVAKLGEPKSNIKAGPREMLFFSHLKLTLKNDVVVETEEIADEPAPRRAADPATTGAANPAAPGANAAPTTTAAQTTAAPPVQPAPANPETASQTGAKSAAEAAAAPVKPAVPPEPQLEIKSIRSGPATTKSGQRPTSNATTAAAAPPPVNPAPVTVTEAKLPTTPLVATSSSFSLVATAAAVTSEPSVPPEAKPSPTVDQDSELKPAPVKPAVDPKKKAAVRQRWRLRRDAETEDEPVQLFSTQSYVIAVIAMIAGIGYLWWRRMQRNLDLAASSVSRTPFESAAEADTTGQFTAELIGRLGSRRFERLVASYYAKTGVVAERTSAGPDAPVHIRIFWKGEPKPFAGVQCHANPPMLIGVTPLQALFTALSAAEIRRGYVVTTGKFNVEARDYAEEKHFTLLSGDLLLEKLNALPPAVRGELLKETSTEETGPSASARPTG